MSRMSFRSRVSRKAPGDARSFRGFVTNDANPDKRRLRLRHEAAKRGRRITANYLGDGRGLPEKRASRTLGGVA
jgi:hypothetical protein